MVVLCKSDCNFTSSNSCTLRWARERWAGESLNIIWFVYRLRLCVGNMTLRNSIPIALISYSINSHGDICYPLIININRYRLTDGYARWDEGSDVVMRNLLYEASRKEVRAAHSYGTLAGNIGIKFESQKYTQSGNNFWTALQQNVFLPHDLETI